MQTEFTQTDVDRFAGELAARFSPDVIRAIVGDKIYHDYVNDPVGFGEDILGDVFTEDLKKLMLSVRDHQITVAMSCNAPGKTFCAARIAVWWFKVFRHSQVWTAAAPPEDNLKKLLWGEIGSIINNHPKLFENYNTKYLHVQRSDQQYLTGAIIPTAGNEKTREAKFSGKHAPHLLFIFDEGDAIPDEVYAGTESCMSGGHVRMLIMFNPRQPIGAVYRMIRDGKANVVHLSAFSHPNVVTGRDVIPGAVDRPTTVRRINQWTRSLAPEENTDSDDVFEIPDFLVGTTCAMPVGGEYPPLKKEYRKITDPCFSYMVLGQYPAHGANQLISREWIYNARARWDAYQAKFGDKPPRDVQPRMGLDAAEAGLDNNVAYFRYGGYVSFPERWGDVDMLETGDRGAQLYKLKNCYVAHVCSIGVGAGVAPHMRRLGCNAYSVKVSKSPTKTSYLGEFGTLRDDLWWRLREWLKNDPGAMLPPVENLIEELATPTYKPVKGKIKVMDKDKMREVLDRSPDDADALAQTFADIPVNDRLSGTRELIIEDPEGWT